MNTKQVNSPFMRRHIVSGKFLPGRCARDVTIFLWALSCSDFSMEVRRRAVDSVGAAAGDESAATLAAGNLDTQSTRLVEEGLRVITCSPFLLLPQVSSHLYIYH